MDIDLNTAQKYVTKLHTNKLEHEANIDRLNQRLNNKAYTSKAPAEVINQTKEHLKTEQELLAKTDQELSNFQSLTK